MNVIFSNCMSRIKDFMFKICLTVWNKFGKLPKGRYAIDIPTVTGLKMKSRASIVQLYCGENTRTGLKHELVVVWTYFSQTKNALYCAYCWRHKTYCKTLNITWYSLFSYLLSSHCLTDVSYTPHSAVL